MGMLISRTHKGASDKIGGSWVNWSFGMSFALPMNRSLPLSDRLRAEADLMETFTVTYGRKFSEMIQHLNQPPTTTRQMSDLQCVRLCVEAVNMMLVSQANVARTLKEFAGPVERQVLEAA